MTAIRSRILMITLLVGTAALAGCARQVGVSDPQRVNVSNVAALRTALGGEAAAKGPIQAGPAPEPTGFATITGTFKLGGSAPPRTPLVVDKEQNVCAPGGKQVLSEELVVDPATGGIKDVVIFLTDKNFKPGDPKWEHPSYAETAEATIEFDQKNCIFLTHVAVMRSTQKCKVLNSDPVGHNTNLAGGGRAKPENFIVASGGSAIYEPGGESPEPFGVSCNIHPWMSARMLVRNSPYFAVTKADGSFEIPHVPAGVDLEFRVWQEKGRYLSKVTVNGQDPKWKQGRMKIKLEPDATQNLDVVVDASAFTK
jgi:hypothetical protein